MIKYGLISQTDARTLEKTIDLICEEFKEDMIYVTEIGLYNCETARGIISYLIVKDKMCFFHGIDNEKDKPIDAPYTIHYIKGDSTEVYNQLDSNSQHLIFVDGDHSLIGVIGDFFAYADKVKVGGYLAFHDTGRHIKPFKDFQHGDISNPDAYISVRKALAKIGMAGAFLEQWSVVFDEADETNEAGGVIVLRKNY